MVMAIRGKLRGLTDASLRCDTQVDCSSAVLQPGSGRDIKVSFRPTAAVAYREAIPLHINGLYTVNVFVTGGILIKGCMIDGFLC